MIEKLVPAITVAVIGAVLIGLGAFGIAAFHNRGPITGSVIQKGHDDAYTSCTTTGKVTMCTPHREKWTLKVRSSSNPDRTKWVTVPREQWSNTTIGQDFSNGADRQ